MNNQMKRRQNRTRRILVTGFILGVLCTLLVGFAGYKMHQYIDTQNAQYAAEQKAITDRVAELEQSGNKVVANAITVWVDKNEKVIVISYDDELCKLQQIEETPEKLQMFANQWLNENHYSTTSCTMTNDGNTLVYHF